MEKPSVSPNVDVETHQSATQHHGGLVPADDSGNGEEPPPDIPSAGSSCKEGVQVNTKSFDGARNTNATPSFTTTINEANKDNIHALAHTLPVEQVISVLETDVQ